MRITIIGQQDFGKAVLEAFLARGDEVAAVFCSPDRPGARADVLHIAAQALGLPVFQFPSLRSADAAAAMRALNVDLAVMAYVLQFAPASLLSTAPFSITRRCCLATADRRRSTGRSRSAKLKPASLFSGLPMAWMRGRCCFSNAARLAQTTRWATCISSACFPKA
jgi:hypothetical protein